MRDQELMLSWELHTQIPGHNIYNHKFGNAVVAPFGAHQDLLSL